LCCPSRQLQAAVGVRLRCFTPGRVSVEHCRRSPRRRQPPARLSFAAPQAVHDDLVAAVSLAAYDHMGDYDGTASPQVCVQVRLEFVNPEHLALNSGSGFLYSRLWRSFGERIAGPI
jgi:hypothetical protein